MRKRRRYPGSKPFNTDQKDIFFGRKKDILRLNELISIRKSVVLYGESGLGKSSLIEAGIVPEINAQRKHKILRISFKAYQKNRTTYTPLSIAYDTLRSERTWLQDKFSKLPVDLWRHFKNKQINNSEDSFLLIFDQFEELFTYPENQINEFAQQLAEVLHTDIPQRYRQVIMDSGSVADETFLSNDQLRTLHRPIELKILIGIRSDRMSYINKLKLYLPEILVHTYELNALDEEQASEAICLPAQQLQDDFESNCFGRCIKCNALVNFKSDNEDKS